MSTHLESRHRTQRQRLAEPEKKTAAVERRKPSPHQQYDDRFSQEEFSWEGAPQRRPQARGPAEAPYITTDAPFAEAPYAISEPAYARVAASYSPADDGYWRADDTYGPVDDGYGAANDTYGPVDGGHGPADDTYGPVDGAYGAADDPYGPADSGYGPADDAYARAGLARDRADDGYGPAIDTNEPADEGYYGPVSDAHGPADGARVHPDVAYAPADADDWDGQTGVVLSAEPELPLDTYAPAMPDKPGVAREDRTAALVNRGRTTAPERQVGRAMKVAAFVLLAAGLVAGLVVLLMPGPGPTWPAGVAKVQGEIARACQNPDVRSEPGQVNFACAKATRQILWVFSLLTSGDNPNFADAKNGRVGLEPITPRQGGMVAWSLNLHHPYDPTDPIDSIQVAARAINNIIGGATVTGTYGNPIVQAGLASSPANCLRYTGSSKVTSHKGFPGLCARPISTVAGQAALVADVYQKWVVGAAPGAAQNAATLFENARNPGSPQVQAILKHLPNSGR